MGMDAIHFVLDKVEDEKLKNVLKYDEKKTTFEQNLT